MHCGVCRRRLYAGLERYILHTPQQQHIAYELHTDEEPIAQATHPMEEDSTRIQCAGRCQTPLWLVDGGSGFIHHVLNRRYAVACGPATSGRPSLCVVTRANSATAHDNVTITTPLDDHFLSALRHATQEEDVDLT